MTQSTTQAAYASIKPVTGRLGQEFDFETDDAVARRLAAGDAAWHAWREVGVAHRAETARRVGDLFGARAGELARIAVEEMGKPMSEAVEEVEFCQAIFHYYAENGPALATD